ncbi:hypothetical protein F5Y15DRAFT_427565 [Xylariaceae sp. FL0016]|nr:hypothetical protein F5Y15DRAFT_427565 [Xylariaceae sp. FL0016]
MGSIDSTHSQTCSSGLGTFRDVAVIGAGVSGIVSAAHLSREGCNVTVFERTPVIGGVWHFDPRVDRDPPFPNTVPPDPKWEEVLTQGLSAEEVSLIHAPPGPCYAGLKNNVSTELMRSSLLRWPEGTPSFVDQGVIRKYIEEIATACHLTDKILFRTRVESVSKPRNSQQWNIKTSSISLDENDSEPIIAMQSWNFDAVVVSSGHYHIPYVPDIPGLAAWRERFPDRVTHSKGYRTPTPFRGKTVLVIGAGSSSLDIVREINGACGKVYQSVRGSAHDFSALRLPEGVERVAIATEFILDDAPRDLLALCPDSSLPGRVVLADGRVIESIDFVMMATGYITSYPFLSDLEQPTMAWEDADEQVLITADGYTTHNLHKDIFYIPDSSLAFIGVSHYVSTFSLYDFQAKVMAKVFSGKAILPSQVDMMTEHQERKARFKPGMRFHAMEFGEQKYISDLLNWVNQDLENAGLEPMDGMDEAWHDSFGVIKEQLKHLQAMPA